MPGPAPKPTALKVLTGNPGKRPLNMAEPRPAPGIPSCPSWLSLEARREWRRITPELSRLGLLSGVDRAALAGYCQCWARWAEAEKTLTEKGMSVEIQREDKDGNLYTYGITARPEVAAALKEAAMMKAFLVEFGLTPASRTRIAAMAPAAPSDPMEALLD